MGGKNRRVRYVCWLLGVAGLSGLAALGYWWFHTPLYRPPAKMVEVDSATLRETVILPTLDTPLPEGQSAIWCGSFQLAWNKLREDVLKGPVHIQNAEEAAERLNRAAFAAADLAPEMAYAAAGRNQDRIQETIRGEMAKRFPDAAVPAMDSEPRGLTAFAYLKAAVSFAEPYLLNPGPFSFTDGRGRTSSVSSFGIPKSNNDVPKRLREQIEILYATPDDTERQPAEFALDLCKHSHPNQLVLARIPRQKSLADTLADLQEKIKAFRVKLSAEPIHRDDVFDFNDRLLVPIMYWDIRHHFRVLEGEDKALLNPGWKDFHMQTALQSIEFRLDPQGAGVASTALIEVKSRMPRHFFFNRPFLIVMKKRDAEHPFFVMWVENAELLNR